MHRYRVAHQIPWSTPRLSVEITALATALSTAVQRATHWLATPSAHATQVAHGVAGRQLASTLSAANCRPLNTAASFCRRVERLLAPLLRTLATKTTPSLAMRIARVNLTDGRESSRSVLSTGVLSRRPFKAAPSSCLADERAQKRLTPAHRVMYCWAIQFSRVVWAENGQANRRFVGMLIVEVRRVPIVEVSSCSTIRRQWAPLYATFATPTTGWSEMRSYTVPKRASGQVTHRLVNVSFAQCSIFQFVPVLKITVFFQFFPIPFHFPKFKMTVFFKFGFLRKMAASNLTFFSYYVRNSTRTSRLICGRLWLQRTLNYWVSLRSGLRTEGWSDLEMYGKRTMEWWRARLWL